MGHIAAQLDLPASGLLPALAEEMALEVELVLPAADPAALLFGLADHPRRFWPRPRVAAALRRLLANIDGSRPGLGLLRQYAPFLLEAAPSRLPLSQRIIARHVHKVVGRFRRATGTA